MLMLTLVGWDEGCGLEPTGREFIVWITPEHPSECKLSNLWGMSSEWFLHNKWGPSALGRVDSFGSFAPLDSDNNSALERKPNRRSETCRSQVLAPYFGETGCTVVGFFDGRPAFGDQNRGDVSSLLSSLYDGGATPDPAVRDICQILFQSARKDGDDFVKQTTHAIVFPMREKGFMAAVCLVLFLIHKFGRC